MPKNSLRIGIALAAGLLLFGVGEVRAGPTEEQILTRVCADMWGQSPARDSCTSAEITADVGDSEDDDRCEISAVCPTGDGEGSQTSDVTVHPSHVPDLNNCDGELTNGSC